MLVSAQQLRKESNIGVDDDEYLLEPLKTRETKTAETIEPPKGVITTNEQNNENRRKTIAAMSQEPAEFAFERAIGKNDSLYSNFVELIALTKRKVGRIVVIENGKRTGFATGFMVSGSWMLTNWHVFRHVEMAEESEVHFFYEYNTLGHPLAPVVFKFDTSKFENSEVLDYCFVGLQLTDITGTVQLSSIGHLYLDRDSGKISDGERLNIIHHPQGLPKQISIRENKFVGVDCQHIFYETDTAPGSSGSPVFNDQWQVVGLHHKSVPKLSKDGKEYLDKDDEVIPVIDGKIDVTRVVWEKNEGVRISVILKDLEQRKLAALLADLSKLPPSEILSFGINGGNMVQPHATTKPTENGIKEASLGQHITIQVPTEALSQEAAIEICLTSKKIGYLNGLPVSVGQQAMPNAENGMDELLLEIAKAEKERGVDFSNCKGYDADFLGVRVPFPQPKPALRSQLARLKDGSIELKYYHYSVIFNAVTKMPLISGVNVEGDATKRLDDSKRKDDWLRDARIDVDVQLDDKFYRKSRFDKGHMGRFEDANWDDTEAKALRNGIFTCFYTNACPQVVGLNRGGGLWGNLEKAVLEKGVKKENGKQARMSVFNGPIFDKEKDRVFKGVVIPMGFFKVIVWLNDQNNPRATAFMLSQETLVDHIQFDEYMGLDAEEALDIDKVATFQNYQVSLKRLSSLTKIDFKPLERFDTFVANKKTESAVVLMDAEHIMV